MDFVNPDKKYRPIPFWSWNEQLDPEQTRQQVSAMDKAGIGGFFMHARGGLQTPYMEEGWFENVCAAVEAAQQTGMRPWAYDENGWPSGFGNGAVNGLGVAYQQKYLRMADAPAQPERSIGFSGSHWFYYDVNPFYVDTLDKEATQVFIREAYEPYWQRFGNAIEGFFTDEPQISRDGIPWSFGFEEEYRRRCGEELLPHLEELFLPVGNYENTRVNFWKMVTDLFSQNFMKPIYDWCSQRGLKLTGHLVCEDTLESQLTSNGACMPHYEYLHIPGMDWLGRNIYHCLTPVQVSSVAQQLGKEAVISETFALCGHNVSFDELKGIYEWQMVHGIDLLCQHLQGYSIRGLRKRDYPPAMYYQQPWWKHYRSFTDAMSRLGMALNQGQNPVDVLVLHPQTTAWALFDCGENRGLTELNEQFLETLRCLEEKHIAYHLGDETILQRHGRVENGRLVVGNHAYSRVICTHCRILLPSTRELLDQFLAAGGQAVSAAQLPENPVVDSPRITYTQRQCPGYTVHYFVNTSAEALTASIAPTGRRLDIDTGELAPFGGQHRFEPWGSLLLIDDGTGSAPEEEAAPTLIPVEGSWRITGPVQNALTLDHCDYWFDGVLQEKNGYVLNICQRANRLGRPVQIRQEYHVRAACLPESVKLVCETPEKFQILVNGQTVTQGPDGWYVDKSFQTLEIGNLLQIGENTITFHCSFRQSEAVYENLRKAAIFESEKNKLAYDMEIEPVYLVGDFGVTTDGSWTQLDRDALRYNGTFLLDTPRREVFPQHLEQQGFPFFCGSLTLEGQVDIRGEYPVLQLCRKGINAVTVEIGGWEKTLLTGSDIPLGDLGIQGKTEVRLTLTNNLRNLLGPHHQKDGEDYFVGPWCFYQEKCVWSPGQPWDDGYCLVETSV